MARLPRCFQHYTTITVKIHLSPTSHGFKSYQKANLQKLKGNIYGTPRSNPHAESPGTTSLQLIARVCIIRKPGLKYGAMCLAVPVKIVSIEGDEAETEIGEVRRRVSIVFTPEAKVGDYVLLHTGYAIGVVDEAEAEETLKLLEEMANLSEVH